MNPTTFSSGTHADPLSEVEEAALSMAPEEFRALGHALVDRIAGLLDSLPDRSVTPAEPPDAVRALLGENAPLPEGGTDTGELLRSAADLLIEHSLLNGHPRFLGYVTASPAPIGMLGDLLAAAVNPNVGAWTLSPVATEIEVQTVRWIAELIDYPRDCGGLFVSGGNMANFVAFLAARTRVLGQDVRANGLGGQPLRVYASADTHTWIQKAADLFGLGTGAIRWIPTDDRHRMDVAELRRTVERDRAAGDIPMLVVATAGSVSTGAVDPLPAIAELCGEEGIWLHVDGAYGGFAAALPDAPDALRALREADSVAVDPHKWLYAPLEAGCVLVRDRAALRDAFSYHPPYYHFGNEAVNFIDYGPQNSRGFRALKVWLALRQVGRSGYVRMIRDNIRASERLHARVDEHPELEALTQSLSITTFRYVPPELQTADDVPAVEEYLNTLNQALLERIQRSGEMFVSNAVIRGKYALRACIVNFNTGERDVEAVAEIAVRLGREVHRALTKEAARAGA
jgi:aromatic-L-amino-acid/L-tryptophan decarboxylase